MTWQVQLPAGSDVCIAGLQADRLGAAPAFDAAAKIGDLHTEALSLQVKTPSCCLALCDCGQLVDMNMLSMFQAMLQA